jgi:hypothetical protein
MLSFIVLGIGVNARYASELTPKEWAIGWGIAIAFIVIYSIFRYFKGGKY